jgi:hypothetical protein
MGGSFEQAKKVYAYFTDFVEDDPDMQQYLLKPPTLTETLSENKVPFKCVTASPKQVRGPHVDNLMIDEACEADDQLVKDAMPMVNTSESPLIIMTSTFHKIFGIFQETWDKAPELGYVRFSWDIFDVCRTFNPEIWKNEDFNREIPDFQDLKKLAAGRTGSSEGWVPVLNVVQAWREKPTLDWFLVEYMGTRPSAAGLVLRPEDVEAAEIDAMEKMRYNYITGAERILGIDWGFSSMTSVVDVFKHADDVKVLVDNKNYVQVRSEIIIEDVVAKVKKGGHKVIYADSAGKFENVALQYALTKARLSCMVVEVNFGTDKVEMLGNLRAHFERRKFKFPAEFIQAKWQLKRYRYAEGTDKPIKQDDHIPDVSTGPIHLTRQQVDKSSDNTTITGGLMGEKF